MLNTPFLKEIAAHILESGKYNLKETCLVFPNKRARIYLSKYIGELTGKPIWAPKYMSVNELMEQLSGFILADKISLVFELFKLYTEISGSKETFDLFYPYSETILSDFDEIDKYLVDAGDLFQNLSALKALEGKFNYLTEDQIKAIQRFWNTFDPNHISEGQKTFLSIWKILPDLYDKFKSVLLSKGMAYEGMAYREVANKIDSNDSLSELQHKKFLFIGFNALNACEKKLFRFLKNQHKASFFYDYDTYYTNNNIHEAGFFIRQNLKDFPPEQHINNENLVKADKQISFIPVSSNTGQTKVIPSILKELDQDSVKNLGQTAIVLADEGLLLPVIYTLPPQVKEVNVTMGYPASESAACNLIDSLYELLRNSKINQQGDRKYSRLDVLSLINNPLLAEIFHAESAQINKKIEHIKQPYIHESEIPSGKNEELIFKNKELAEHADRYLISVFELVIRNMAMNEMINQSARSLQVESLYQVYTLITRLHDTIASSHTELNAGTFFKLLKKLLRNHHIPFSGEPLAGLQIMGILETRTLDFDNIIMLSVNEGVMPKPGQLSSFVPYSLRYGFGLPTSEHQDSIYAYYFYRLLQRANRVYLIYNNSNEGLQTGERSRFMHQLDYDFPVEIKERSLVFNIANTPEKSITVTKTGFVGQILVDKYLNNKKVLTPSAINEFLNCPLKFYFHYVAGLSQPDEVVDVIDQKLFGNLLHKCMKLLYETFSSKNIEQSDLKILLKKPDTFHAIIEQAFLEEVFKQNRDCPTVKIEGFNLVIKQIIFKYLLRIIQYDITLAPFEIISLEQFYSIPFSINNNGSQQEIAIGGIIDRIDRHKGVVRILDYKTGKTKNAFSDLEALFDNGNKERNDAALQVLTYSLVYDHLYKGNTILPGLIFIRDIYKDRFAYGIKHGRNDLHSFAEVGDEFHNRLSDCLARIFDENEPFYQTENTKTCAYCPYAKICHRQSYS